jgi:hypothetical protein
MAKQANAHASPMSERARGVPEDHEDLLAPEVLQASASEPEPMSSPVMVEAAASSPATLPTTPAAEPATEPVIAPKAPPLVDTTITVSMKVSLDATGTLEIPPEMIFAPAPVAKSPTMAVDGPLNQKDAAAAASDSKQSEAQQLDLLGDSAPKIAAG